MITCREIRKILHYDAKRGVWRWRVRPARHVQLGSIAGSVNSNGYRHIMINGKQYKSSRLAWFYIYGYFPENQVDHINRNPSDDRWCNLREVSHQCNIRNCGMRNDNTSGIKGVSWNKRDEKWQARVAVNGKSKSLGYHADFTEAVAHRLAAEQCLDWGGCDSSSPAFRHMEEYRGGR